MQKSRSIKIISMVMTLLMFVTMINFPKELMADTNATFETDGISVVFDRTTFWDTNTQVSVTLTNNNDSCVLDWCLHLQYSEDVSIVSIWNANTDINNELNIIPDTYNSVILPGQSITFGFVSNSITEGLLPSGCIITTSIENTGSNDDPSSEVSVFPYAIFTQSGFQFRGWKSEIVGDVFSGTDIIYNASELALHGTLESVNTIVTNGWNINVDNQIAPSSNIQMPDWSNELSNYALTLSEILCEDLTTQDMVVVDGYCYVNGNININSSIFQGNSIIVASGDIVYNVNSINSTGEVILYSRNGNITINGTEITVNGIMYAPNGSVNINAYNTTVNGRIVADSFSYEGSIFNIIASDDDLFFIDEIPEIIVTPTVTDIPNPSVTDIPEITSEPSVTPTPDVYLDSDNDGLPDILENEIGTNINNSDTDNDGISDYWEFIYGLDPLTDSSEDDYDGDGLNNGEELLHGTLFYVVDTDYDGLTDYDEIFVYGTNPLVPDTDSDGISDGDEIIMGKNPLDSSDKDIRINQTTETDINNPDDDFLTNVSVSIGLSKYIEDEVSIRDLYNVDFYSTDVYGRIGSPVSFTCEETFDIATIVFTYDDANLGFDESDLGVLWYNEENGTYILQEQAVVDSINNTVTLTVAHFSTYLLVNKNMWLNIPYINYDLSDSVVTPYPARDINENYDFFFILTGNSSESVRHNELVTLQRFVSNMRDGDRVCTIMLGANMSYSYATFMSSTAYQKQQLLVRAEEYLETATISYPYTTGFLGVMRTIDACTDVGNSRMVFALEDATSMWLIAEDIDGYEVDYDLFESGLVLMATDRVANGPQYAEEQGFEYYEYPLYSDLWNNFWNYGNLSAPEFTVMDSDGDGLPDYLEDQGYVATNGKTYYSNPNKADTDEEGLTDSEEIEYFYTIYRDTNGRTINIYIEDNLVYSTNDGSITDSRFIGLNPFAKGIKPGDTRVVVLVASDPSLPDSDGDYYNDANDPRPMYRNIFSIGIGGKSYIENEFDTDFIHIIGNGIEEYGGNQSNIYYGGNNDLLYGNQREWVTDNQFYINREELLRSSGCGLIAFANVVAYKDSNDNCITQNEYTYYLNYASGYCPILDIPLVGSTGVLVFSICDGLNQMNEINYSYWNMNKDTYIEEITRMLSNDMPVIMAYYGKDASDGLDLYEYIFNQDNIGDNAYWIAGAYYIRHAPIYSHYYTVTGIIYDEIIDDYYIRISTWGKEMYFSWNEYISRSSGIDGLVGSGIISVCS